MLQEVAFNVKFYKKIRCKFVAFKV